MRTRRRSEEIEFIGRAMQRCVHRFDGHFVALQPLRNFGFARERRRLGRSVHVSTRIDSLIHRLTPCGMTRQFGRRSFHGKRRIIAITLAPIIFVRFSI